MNPKKLLLSAALLAPVLVAFTLPAEKIRFAPAAGADATKTFENKMELSLDHLSVTMNGNEMPGMPEMDMSMTHSQKVAVTDEYVAMEGALPKLLKRHFDSMESGAAVSVKMEMAGQSNNNDMNVKAQSELDGKTVVFTWDADAKEYKKAFDPTEEKAELLEGLTEDMDLRVLLPDHEVKKGDAWDVDVKSLVHVLAPGGNLAFKPEEGADEADPMSGMGMGAGMGSMHDYLSDLLEGECKATLSDVREEDGKQLAVIKLTMKISSSKDMTDVVKDAMKDSEKPEGVEMDFDHMDVDLKLECEGELIWNLAANRVESLELSGPVSMNMDMAMKVAMGDRSMNLEQAFELSGTYTSSVKTK